LKYHLTRDFILPLPEVLVGLKLLAGDHKDHRGVAAAVVGVTTTTTNTETDPARRLRR
jgi:hypothetical protein